MADNELFGDRRRVQEDEYFRRQEQELIAKLQQRGREEAARKGMKEVTGVADDEILQDLLALGYTPETVMLLHLVPLVQMAWAEGDVSDGERSLIIEAARARGIEKDSPADRQLAQWLASRPTDDLFEKTLRAVNAILESRSPEERNASQKDLLSRLTAIASASGGILGFGKGVAAGNRRCSRASLRRCNEREKKAAPRSAANPASGSSSGQTPNRANRDLTRSFRPEGKHRIDPGSAPGGAECRERSRQQKGCRDHHERQRIGRRRVVQIRLQHADEEERHGEPYGEPAVQPATAPASPPSPARWPAGRRAPCGRRIPASAATPTSRSRR